MVFSPTGLEQQFLQELLALRVPQQYRGRPELSGGPFLRPLPVPRDTQTQQKAAAQLPVPPLLQQRTLHQRLPSGEPAGGAAHQSGAAPHRQQPKLKTAAQCEGPFWAVNQMHKFMTKSTWEEHTKCCLTRTKTLRSDAYPHASSQLLVYSPPFFNLLVLKV